MFSYMRTSVMPQSEVIFYTEEDTVPVPGMVESPAEQGAGEMLDVHCPTRNAGSRTAATGGGFPADGIYELRRPIKTSNAAFCTSSRERAWSSCLMESRRKVRFPGRN